MEDFIDRLKKRYEDLEDEGEGGVRVPRRPKDPRPFCGVALSEDEPHEEV